MSDERVAIYLGGPWHGKTAPVRGLTKVGTEYSPKGETRFTYELDVLTKQLGNDTWSKVYTYRHKGKDGKLEPVGGHEELLENHRRRHGVEFIYPAGAWPRPIELMY